eukprot:gene25287-30866_t
MVICHVEAVVATMMATAFQTLRTVHYRNMNRDATRGVEDIVTLVITRFRRVTNKVRASILVNLSNGCAPPSLSSAAVSAQFSGMEDVDGDAARQRAASLLRQMEQALKTRSTGSKQSANKGFVGSEQRLASESGKNPKEAPFESMVVDGSMHSPNSVLGGRAASHLEASHSMPNLPTTSTPAGSKLTWTQKRATRLSTQSTQPPASEYPPTPSAEDSGNSGGPPAPNGL